MPENDESLDTPTPRTAPDTSQLHPGVASLLKWFECDPLPPHLRSVAEPLRDFAYQAAQNLPSDPELTAGLRKLLEAKDCLVRAKLSAEK